MGGILILSTLIANLIFWSGFNTPMIWLVYITLLGLIITVILDIFFMPYFGCYAAAWSRLLSYVVMIIVSYFLGLRYYPIPYNLKAIFTYFAVGLSLYGISELLVHCRPHRAPVAERGLMPGTARRQEIHQRGHSLHALWQSDLLAGRPDALTQPGKVKNCKWLLHIALYRCHFGVGIVSIRPSE